MDPRRRAGFPTLTVLLVLAVLLVLMGGGPAPVRAAPGDHLLDVDVPSVDVEGDFLVDGAPASPSAGDVALVSLVDGAGEAVTIGSTNAQSYGPFKLIPGSYGAVYDFLFSSGALPLNVGTPFAIGLTVDGGGPLDLDIPTVEITFTLLLDGSPFPAAPETGTFYLRHVATGVEFPLGAGASSPITARLIPGDYDVVYAYVSGTIVPRNTHAVVLAGSTFVQDGAVLIDLEPIAHAVQATQDGAPFSPSPLERGEIRFVDFQSGDDVSFGTTDALVGPLPILPGTYDVVYSRVAGGTVAPINSNAVVLEDEVVAPLPPPQLSLTFVDVETFAVSRDVTIDGAPASPSPLERGDIVLVGANGDEIDFGSTHEASPTYRVIAGRYDVFYRGVIGYTAVPGNKNFQIARGYHIDLDEVVTVDIPTVELSFDLRVDGAPFSPSPLERGRFTLVGTEPGDEIDLGMTDVPPPTPRVAAGTYDLVYDWVAGSVLVPRNEGFRAVEDAAYLVDQTVAVDLATRTIVPTFSLDGSPFPGNAAQSGEIVLRDGDGGELSLGTTDVPVPPDVLGIQAVYSVEYQWVAGIDVPLNPRSPVAVSYVPEPGAWPSLVAGVGMLALLRRFGARMHERS